MASAASATSVNSGKQGPSIQDINIPRRANILLVVGKQSRVSVHNEVGFKVKVLELDSQDKITWEMVEWNQVLVLFTPHLSGSHEHGLVTYALQKRVQNIFTAHNVADFYGLLTSYFQSMCSSDGFGIKFDVPRRMIPSSQKPVLTFAPTEIGRANAYGKRVGYRDDSTLHRLFDDVVALEDRHLPSLMVYQKYQKKINKSFDLAGPLKMAQAYRAATRRVLPVQVDHALFEIVHYLMQQKMLLNVSAPEIAEEIFRDVQHYFPQYGEDLRLKKMIRASVRVAQRWDPELQQQLEG